MVDADLSPAGRVPVTGTWLGTALADELVFIAVSAGVVVETKGEMRAGASAGFAALDPVSGAFADCAKALESMRAVAATQSSLSVNVDFNCALLRRANL